MARKQKLQASQVELLLDDLAGELLQRGCTSPMKILVIGGAYMLLRMGNRASTGDVDIFPLNFAATFQPDERTRLFQKAIKAVARRHSLQQEWLNDAAFGVVGELLPPALQLELWKVFREILEVYLPPADFMLAMKLFSYRDQDYADVEALTMALQIETREQAQRLLDRYIDRPTQEEYRTPETLDFLFED
ncbi:hypothetical protein EI42_06300 [Thermosporothrix hazakensis]|jgi:hypothetical protein|uniref:Nucleotidyltransferase AbiEii toxin of type IV toxin-antitoxin system n=2 Tax=Thermosporothrix TaxID=768650 RepID=A0A326TRT2_THEHA|nr:hypothetical protein [Thermosporothrix hazakensis]PZW18218.1 hypothetical protein EI42_06300 [Thermosporothrix hazakensis]BBH87907.1 hypothetical protein KTC_26580 [Thermosporothrix sp. COM3]GCE50339.1 hypothetical protein KTH_52080 [Thermosporothrix hazakensis]